MRLEHRAAGCLGRVRREDELDPQPRSGGLDLGLVDPAPVQLRERIGERLAWNPSLGLVLAAPADPVVLLGDVDELEEQRERPQDCALPLGAERRDRSTESASRAARARIARQRPDSLFLVEELLALLLDEHAPEQVAEQAHVGAEGGIGRHEKSLEGQESRQASRLPRATRAGTARSRGSRWARRAAAA